ncbi:MAG: SdrD B-like domain-containing protein [Gemmataceae bacterium]
MRTAFTQINTTGTATGNDMTSFVNIAATESGTILTYDQWEDGYETNIENPVQSTTQIWGDGNPANGAWPGAPAGTDPAITAGQVIRLRNDIPVNPRVQANLFFDGGDKIGANKTVAVSRAQFPVTPGSVIASAVEVRDIRFYGTTYTAPVGTNTANAGSMYTYVSFFVMASQDNTTVQIDRDNNGTFDQTVVLNQGQSLATAGNILQGGRVVANKPVQVQLMTGHVGGQYASRSYTLFPDSQLTNNYFTPVGQVNATYPVAIYVFNPNATAINVSTETRNNSGLVISTPVSVPAGSSVRFTAPAPPTGQITGMRVFSPNGENFAALGASDAGSTTYDWAFSLQPVSSLSQLALVALGVGNSANPPSGAANSSPVWATVLGNTTLYVDYDGNPATGANTDPLGNKYDASFSLQRLQSIQLRDSSDNDNSGMRLYTVDGTLISTAWGEDPNTAPAGAPGFDAGTTVPAVPVPEFYKFADFAPGGDANGDGYFNSGDTVRYTLRIRHIGTTPISNVLITDALPPEATYVANSTRVDFGAGFSSIPDSGATAFPLDEAGYNIANLVAGSTTFLTFDVTINSGLPAGTTEMTNNALLAFDIFRLPAIKTLQLRTAVGDTIWHDMNGNGVQDAGEPGIPNVGLTLVWFGPNGVLGGGDDVTYTRTTDANGVYRFTDLPSGNFSLTVNTATLPANFTPTFDLDGVGTANTILFTQAAAQARTDADFGYRGNSALGDLVWYDVNGNGTRETGTVTEPVIPGATVTLTFAGRDGDLTTTIDNITYTTTTNASGLYSFTNLFGGGFNGANPNYRVTVTPPAAYTAQTYDATAPTTDSTSTLQLAANTTNLLQDFGYRGTAALGNFVWRDDNGNGVQNAGEPGIDGIPVQLLDSLGNVIAQTTTAGGGLYSFPGLIAGNYSLRFGNSNGTITFVRTARDAGGNDAIDSDADPVTGQTGTYTLAAGQTNNTVAQGLYQPASFGDRIWFDINGNGTQDGGEPGINGVTVLLDYAGLDGTFGTADDQTAVASQVTSANGNYTFSNLAPGTYRARVNTATLPVGFNAPTFDLDGTGTANQATFTLVSNQNRTDVDFGYRGTGIIGDRVWHDMNGNGVQDAGEPGIPNVSLTITWLGFDGVAGGGDDIAYSATTDASGAYSVSNLPGGNFTIAVNTASLPDNFTPTFDLDGIGSPNTTARNLIAGQNAADVDFGYTGNASIGDRVWFDVDGDGVQDNVLGDGFEPGIPGVTVTLLFGGDDGDLATTADNITYTTVTGADGLYTFAGLFGGDITGVNPNYRVTVTPPAGYPVPSFDSDGTVTANQSSLQLAGGSANTAQDFGYRGPATQGIGNFVWQDSNGNGRQDAGEPGLAGVTVELWSAGVQLDVTTTNASGNYAFSNLPTSGIFGPYQIRVTAPAGFVFTTQASPVATGSTDSDMNASGQSGAVTVLAGTVNNDVDAGLYVPITLGDRVYLDQNGNGVQDGGEPGISGATVTVTWLGVDGIASGDDATSTTTSGANGSWSIGGLPPGNYTVQVTPPAGGGFVITDSIDNGVLNAANPASITVVSGDTRNDVDFGFRGTGSIGDRVWHDINGNGVQDAGEPGLFGVGVTLTWAGVDGTFGTADDATYSAITGVNGAYTFANLPAGSFRANVNAATLPAFAISTDSIDDGTVTPGATVTFTLSAAQTRNDIDFGFTGDGVIGDLVWYDVNGNGVRETGTVNEPGVAGATVTLTFGGQDGDLGTAADNLTYVTTTDSNGNYTFANLFGGDFNGTNPNYRVTVTPPSGFTVPTYDATSPTTDSTSTLRLANGETNTAQDFGYRGTAAFGNFVWLDSNGNGLQDGGEPGIDGITVQLLDAGGAVVAQTTTAGGGAYSFPGLVAGSYSLRFGNTVGAVTYSRTLPNAGVNDAIDSDADPITGQTPPIVLAAGQINNDVDAGLSQSVTIGDRVWFDTNADGVQDAGEAGINGVTVLLDYAGADGVFGTGGDDLFGISSQVTTGDGDYAFTGFGPGTYRVRVDAASLPAGLDTPTFDFDGTGTPNAAIISLTSGQISNLVDFGYRGAGVIGDRVWLDSNGNGVQDAVALEPGLPGVTLGLTWAGRDGTFGTADDVALGTTTTNGSGNYSFANLPAGNFRAVVQAATLPANVTQTFDLNGPLDNAATQTLTPGQIASTLDFGYVGAASIGDRVWYDADGDGTQNNAEPGISGATVTLLWSGPDGNINTSADNVTYVTTTDANGNYLFAGLPVNGASDGYRVTVTPPAGFVVPTFDADGIGSPNVSGLSLGAGETNLNQDFGYRGLPSQGIGNFVWDDLNGNGRQDAGEPGIDGITVELYDATGTALYAITTTTGGGLYAFPNLVPGTYQVRFDTGAYSRTAANIGANDAIDSDANVATGFSGSVIVSAGAFTTDVDAGLYTPVSFGDRVWFDVNADGVQDAGEPGIAGVPVSVTWFGPDGVLGGGDDQVFNATTGANGLWSVTGVPPGNYAVAANPPASSGFTVLTDSVDDGVLDASNPVFTAVQSGDTRTDADFGFRGTGVIGDRVWHDVNGDGVQDAGEPGIPDATVQLTWAGSDGVLGTADDALLTTTTDANGLYAFANLPAGVFRVDVIPASLPDNATPTFDFDGIATANTAQFTLPSGGNNPDLDFGYTGDASIGDRVWYDVDGDGVQDNTAGDGFEPGIVGATVTLVFAGNDGDLATAIDNITYTTTTGANGIYTFAGLFGGDIVGANPNYRVSVTPPAGYPTATFDATAPITDFTSTLQLAAGQTDTQQDFGVRGPATQGIGDFVWNDLNGNGRQDAGEPGLPGVTVELLAGGTVIDVTTTDGSGRYSFPSLAESSLFGLYQVRVTAPSGLVFGVPNSPVATGATDSDVDAAGLTPSINVLVDTFNTDVDAALYAPVSLGQRVWFDSNGNGTQDMGEPGIPGVAVQVTWFGPNGNQTFNTTTNANGDWTVSNLPPGDYAVTLTNVPAGLVPTFDLDGTATPNTTLLSTTSGVNRTDVNFGLTGTGTIGDRVWIDSNGDGVQDATTLEPGLPGVSLTLTWAGIDGVIDTADDIVIATANGDASGLYSFANVPAGSLRVTVNPASVPGNMAPSFDLDGTATPGTTVITLAAGETRTDADFGYTGNASIGNRVWFDRNRDGLQNPFEPGIPGAVVQLVWSGPDGDLGTTADNVTFTTTTDANGNYLFPGLPVVGLAQTYQATVLSLPLGGLVPTFDLDSGTTAPDQTTLITLATANPARTDANFGYTGTGSLSGSAFRDDNNDGIPNGTEPGLPGVTVTLTGVDPFGNAIVDSITGLPYTATTDANGNYTFTSLVPGVYTLTETQPANYADGLDSAGTLGGNPANDVVAGINMGPAASGTGYNFGERGSTIGGTVYRDSNRDGTRQPGEPGIPGVTIELYDPITNNLIATTTTDANGSYTFVNLPAGNYRIVEIQPQDYGNSPVGPATTRDVTLTTGGLPNQDFGETLGSIGGTVYSDLNGNGVRDAGEPGLAGVAVQLTGFLQAGVFTIAGTTDANGNFLFDNLVPASYNLAETQPAGYSQGTNAAGTLGGIVGPAVDTINGITMTPGATGTAYTFGEAPPSGTFVAGTVFLDLDGNGLPGGLGETGIASVTIELLNAGGTVVQTVTTAPDGSYIFTNVTPGDYTVRETQPAGYGSSTPNSVSLTVPAAGTSGVNFGETLSGLSGAVYFDANRDGTRQAGEPGIPGVTVTLSGTDALGNPVNQSTITDASGNYDFTGLAAGTYILTETQPAGWTDGAESTGTAGGTLVSPDSITSIPLGSGASASGYNFGEVGVAVTGTVFRDDNKNGSLDGGEPGLPGISIRLLDPNGNVVSTTTTNPDGSYSFPNVPPGNYTLVEVQPPGYGDVPGGPFAPNSRPITVGNVPVSNQNFADALSSIAGSVFIDANGNGTRDSGEAGIGGLPIRLDSAGADNVFGTADDVTGFRTTTTDVSGNYTFTLLPTGVYRVVEVSQPSPFLDGPETAGPAGGDTSVNDQISNIPLAAGTDIAGYTFAEIQPGPAGSTFISGTVYLDTNGNGVQDAGEPGVPNVLVSIFSGGTIPPANILTDANGNYVFTGVIPGLTYTVSEGQPAGYASGPENAGNVTDVFIPANGAAGVNFGETPGSISGTVYFDRDADGGFNAGDTPLSGVTVTLLDSNGNTIATQITAADGSYTFTNLAAGTYRVVETQPTGYNQGVNTPGAGASVSATDELTFTLTPGLASTGNNFGERGASIGGTVWIDTNRDGIRNPSETAGIPNVTITLLDANGAVVGSTTTTANGSYTFTNLPPGNYTLVQTQPPAYGSSTSNSIPITLTTTGAANANFGETLATLSGTVFADTDGDGIRDAGENGISGVTVTLTGTDVDGNPVNRTTTTDASGNYTFSDLPAGTYTITETQPTAFGDGPDTVGSAGGDLAPTDSIIRVPVGAGSTSTSYAFAEVTSTITGSVYRDYNLDGTFNTTGANPDTGIAGITITLTGTDADGRAVSLTTVTDANGRYTFSGLGGGSYTITETQPPLPTTLFNGYYDGADNIGTPEGTNPAKNQLAVTFAAGQNPANYNFGELPPADPFGYVYVDLNQNGVRDTGEPGIANVAITISGTAFAGTPFARPLVASDIPGGSLTIFTDATGRYEFSPIPPGLYTLTEAQPLGYVDGQEQDGDPNGPAATVGNDVISNIVLAPFPIRGPFNFGEIQQLNPPGPLPPIDFFPPPDPSKRSFLASTPTGVPTTLPVVPNFAAFNPGARPAAFASVASEEGGLVRVFDFAAGVERFRFSPFPGFTGSVRIATADVTGDGIPDIIAVPGAGGGPVVKVFDGNTGAEVRSFFAFEESFRGGLRIAAADLNGDFMAELIVTPDAGGGPIVRAFDGATGAVVANFFALDENFRGGLRIAAADVNNDGTGDLLVTAGVGGGPRISIYDGAALTTTQAKLGPDFFGFAPELRTGFWISGGDVNGDGFADIVMGAGEGGSPRVVVYSGQAFSTGGGAVAIASFFAGDSSLRSGARINAVDLNGDGRAEVMSAAGPTTYPVAYIYDPLTGALRDAFVALPVTSTRGVNLG